MEFYKILQSIMESKSLSIPDVSRETGLSDSTIRSIISRRTKNISLEVAFKFSTGLGVSLEELNGENINSKFGSTQENILPIVESNLLINFNKLNELGKSKVINYTDDLIDNPKYTESNIVEMPITKKKDIWEEEGKEHLMPRAAHAIDGDFTEEEISNDDKLMEDEDLWK